ncbi:nuclease inhibitor protein [Escherichia coli]|nr:nuclease inhibitor protein [Escherichia coli]OKX01240.1 nuclease inhibitor protein [Escherichia coli]
MRNTDSLINIFRPVTRAFDDDVEFQERMAEHIRYMVETIAHHQVDIDSEV